MLTKDYLISMTKTAKTMNSNVYIIKKNNEITVEIFSGYPKDYHNFNNAVVAMTPKSILKDNWCIYDHTEMTIDKMITRINEEVTKCIL